MSRAELSSAGFSAAIWWCAAPPEGQLGAGGDFSVSFSAEEHREGVASAFAPRWSCRRFAGSSVRFVAARSLASSFHRSSVFFFEG